MGGKVNAADLYPEATHGRLQDLNAPQKQHHEAAIMVTKEIEGSEQSEREKKLWRDNRTLRTDDRLGFFIIFGTVVTGLLLLLDGLFSRAGFHLVGIVATALGALLVLAVFYLIIRAIKNMANSNKKSSSKDDNNKASANTDNSQ